MTESKKSVIDEMSVIGITILETLNTRGCLHVMDIAAEIDEHPVSIDRKCNDLQKQELARMCGSGVYTLTERGERVCEG